MNSHERGLCVGAVLTSTRRGWRALSLVLFLAGTLYAEPLKFDNGDKVVFLGDSITQQALYTQYVEQYFFLRYPEKTVDFRNAGVGGDRTVNVPDRFDRDVAAHEPTHVFIMLGMNDGGYRDFSKQRFELYTSDMEAIIEQIRLIGAEPVLLSPSHFDWAIAKIAGEENGTPYKESAAVYAEVLKQYGDWLKRLAEAQELHFVDTWAPMKDVLEARRASEPEFTLTEDGIHPLPIGHVVIASAILDQLGLASGPVCDLRVSAGMAEDRVGGEVSGFVRFENSLTFEHRATSLPAVFSPEATLAVDTLGIGELFGTERLQIEGLEPGSEWQLAIDHSIAGRWSAEALGEGIEWYRNRATPQHLQALFVLQRSLGRHAKQVDLRAWWEQKKRKDYAVYEAGPPLLEILSEHNAWLADFDAANEVLNVMMDGLRESIEERAQPRTRRYVLRKL